jgi:uncharacterized protein YbjT (DUF2867 family)
MSTEAEPRRVLVAGGSGRFRGVASMLLWRGHRVSVMTRHSGSPLAGELRGAGARIVPGDFEDSASIEAAAHDADAVFAAGTAHHVGPEGELRHGRNLARALAATGIEQLVYVSGDGAAPDSPIPLFRAKFAVEEAIRSAGLPHTILAPTYFMENLFNPWNVGALRARILPSSIAVELPLQQTAIADLLALAVIAVEEPARFAGQRIGLASEEISGEEAAAVLERTVGRDFSAEQLPTTGLPPGLQALFAWLERVGHQVDVPALHRRFPLIGWHTYESWAREQLPRFRELCPEPGPAHAHA